MVRVRVNEGQVSPISGIVSLGSVQRVVFTGLAGLVFPVSMLLTTRYEP